MLVKLVLGVCLLQSVANAGPPLQSEIPIGFDGPNEPLEQVNKAEQQWYQEEPTYRLPLSIRPSHYDLEIRPILDSTGADQNTAPGKVTIRVGCFETTDSITLHSKPGVNISHDEITVVGVAPEGDAAVTGHVVDEARSFYTILLDRNLTLGAEYQVTIPFVSPVATDRLDGLYRSSYVAADSTTKYLATTQFQKDDASRAFPCFDEPSGAFRATFNVKIGRKEVGFHSLANTERVGDPEPIDGLPGWVWDMHNTTVNMPVYLIAIIVSDFVSETAPSDLYRLPVKTWAAPPLVTETSAQFSAQAAARILNFFEEYYDYPYQLNKMDSVAVPDFAAGAMENWGLNTYRTNLMIWLEEENTYFEKWRSAAVIAHELVHQWFGNLVTCEWWNDTWLNEGFARYMQFIGANFTGGDFRSMDRYVVDTTQLAMAYDEGENTEPVHSNVTDRIVNQASRVAYEKAAALIRMMQSFLTEDTLIKGLRVYLKRHEYTGVVQDDLFTALTEQAVADGTFTEYTVKEIMDTWTYQSGFPIVHVSRVSAQTLLLSQEKYLADPLSNVSSDEMWYVPVSYVLSSNPDFSADNTRPKLWIDTDTLSLSVTLNSTFDWIIVNPDAMGFYRVVYDSDLTNAIQNQLNSDHSQISFSSRSQLIDDYFRAASAKYIPIQSALNMTRYLSAEDDFIVWTTVVNNLTPLYNRLADTSAFTNFQTYVLSLVMEPLQRIGANQLPTDSTPTVVLRTQLLDWACSLSHQLCSQTASALFADWMADPNQATAPIPTDIQPMLYCGAVAASNDPSNTQIQAFLLQEYVRNRDTRQQTLIVNALACDQVPATLSSLLERAIDTGANNELDVRRHGLALLQSLARNSAARELVWNFVVTRQADITAVHGAMAVPNIITTLAPFLSSSSTGDLPSRVETFIRDSLTDPDIPANVLTSLQTSLNTITQNSVWAAYYFGAVNAWLQFAVQA